MTILEALRQVTSTIKTWSETNFLNKNDHIIDSSLDETSVNPVQNKIINAAIKQLASNKVNISDIINNLTTNTSTKPLSAAQGVEIKKLIDAIVLPTKVSQLSNDKGYISGYTETDPTVPSWAKASSKPSYTATEVGADSAGTASSAVSSHNSATNTHTDIRTSIQNLQTKVDDISVPTKVSQLTNDKNYISSYTETDPTVPSWAKATSKPTYTKSEVGLGNVDNVKQYSASNPPPYPVKSVNGKTGAVTISALPAVTTADNGKVLMVVSGAWQAVDLNLSVDSNGVVSV